MLFWAFLFYSFGGYLLEKWFAAWAHSENQVRKGLLILPLCPVYGLGMTAVLLLPAPLLTGPRLILSGAAATTAVEYLYHWACEKLLGVKFWNYAGVRGNLNGRICLPFTLCWGALTAAALWIFQPLLAALTPRIPDWLTFAAALILTADAVCSVRVLAVTHDTEALELPVFRRSE